MDADYKFVDFVTYCPKCKYEDLEETKDPCNECLEEGRNYGTSKPTMFEEKEK